MSRRARRQARPSEDRALRFSLRPPGEAGQGRDLFPVLAAMIRWGDRWLQGGRGAPVTLRHTACGRATRAEMVCSECGKPLEAREVRAELGPGFPARLARHPKVRARFGAARKRPVVEDLVSPPRR